jgi:2-oxoglutarate dehydrogenase E1 component
MPNADLIQRANADYLEHLYRRYQRDPRDVDAPWRTFFADLDDGQVKAARAPTPASCPTCRGFPCPLSVQIANLVHAYREWGHVIAELDPLGHNRPSHPLLQLSEFDLSSQDLDRTVGCGGFLGHTDGTLRDLLGRLRATYCGTFAVQFTEIPDKAQRQWLQERMEPALNRPPLSADETRAILGDIAAAQGFEEFLQAKYVGVKRFSLEGAESLIPLLNTLVRDGADLGVEQLVMGMAHRGRLNVLAHVVGKAYELILTEFEDRQLRPHDESDGDVKYHLGYGSDIITTSNKKIHVALSFNPSHLELVDPVVEGIVRGKQYALGDHERSRVVPVLIHGDAAFTGQGIVQETLALSEMPYWRTGGTIHVIVNNQIGFTTMPKQGRFTPYPTDVARMIQAPIFHVNGDHPEACVHAAKLAIAFRQQFHCDVLIDLWCYRRHGHNEVDDPTFTQPLMYREIAAHPTVREAWSRKLLAQKRIGQDEVTSLKEDRRRRLDAALAVAREQHPRHADVPFGGLWKGLARAGNDWSARTQVGAEQLARIGELATTVPPGFTVHPKLKRLLAARRDMAQGRAAVDWGCAEMLALGSLVLLEKVPTRFVGQDVQRGTFSHRHACLHDYNTGQKYYPLANLAPDQAPIIIVNTMLSELAVLGFEYGFASADPRNLVVWEAQFGDFVNGAQPVIDQFIAAGESKWQKMCGLVMLLPHGYEGQGPEHSYAYLDRFLAACAENNLQVCQPTMPAQYFHLLRRQMLRNFRKPLVLMMPKSLLRLEHSASPIEAFTSESFQSVLDDPAGIEAGRARRLVLCSGKVYFTLDEARRRHGVDDVAIVRVEQLYPFAQKDISRVLERYGAAEEVGWVQEEPQNRGAWRFMEPRLRALIGPMQYLSYFGRGESASPAVGSYKLHQVEEEEIVSHALGLEGRAERGEQRLEVRG